MSGVELTPEKVARLEKLLQRNVKLLTKEEREALKGHYRKIKAEGLASVKQQERENPYWFYEPTDGNIEGERRQFLEKYLKREDIPQKLVGSLQIHMSEAGIRGASGGNQSGKSTTAIIESLMKASGVVPFCFDPTKASFKWRLPEKRYLWTEPQVVRVISIDYQNGILKNMLPQFRHWTPKEFLLNGKWEDSYSAEKQILSIYWEGKLRGSIEFMSNNQDLASFQGPARHMLVFDEEPDHEIYKENILRLTTAKEFDVLFAMTPTNGLPAKNEKPLVTPIQAPSTVGTIDSASSA